jgi:hypothetical protein
LSFCEQTADATSRYLEKAPLGDAEGDKTAIPASWPLAVVIKGWELLHTFIKPVLDADNLKVPYPLVQFLTEHIGRLGPVGNPRFVIEISPELNYFQHQHTDLRKALGYLQSIVGGPPVESKLGFLALPCSQSKGLFMNCLLYHEVGHYLAEETGLLSPEELEDLRNELKGSFQQYTYWAVSTIQTLMEELFADLVAVKLLGLAYTLSYMELLRLVTDLSQDQLRTFSMDHPADTLRFREQLKILKRDGWERHATVLPQWAHLIQISETGTSEYSVPPDCRNDPETSQVWKLLIDRLCNSRWIEVIHGKVDTLLTERDNPVEFFTDYGNGVRECLAHGVVPSREQGGSMPHPLGIINGGIFFLLSSMDDLYSVVRGGPKGAVAKRAFLESRVEMWCLKAIEDWLVRKRQDKGSQERHHAPAS